MFTNQALRGPFPPIISSGYDNLSNWPSLLNRPTLSGNTLSWIGPIGGGPSTSNDTQQSRALIVSGITSTSSNNQIIEGLKLSGGLIINHTGVIVRQCYIAGGGFAGIAVVNTTGPTIIEDCAHDASGSSIFQGIAQTAGGGGEIFNCTMRRLNMFGWDNHIAQGLTNSSVIDSFFWDWSGTDSDYVEIDSGNVGLIKHNYFDASHGPHSPGGSTLDSGTNPNNFFGSCKNITIDNNAFANNQNHCMTLGGTSGDHVSVALINNGFFNIGGNAYQSNNGFLDILSNSGNFNMATALAISGTPTNGTGQI